MDKIIYKLPKGISLSKYLQEKAIGYWDIRLFGDHFYIPITKEMKKQFHLTKRKGEIMSKNWKELERIYNIIRDIIDSIRIQIRDYTCAGIEQNLHQELQQGFSNLFEKYIHKRVRKEINLKLIKK